MSAKRIKNPNQPIKTRAHTTYRAMIKRFSAKYWKSGRRKGMLRQPEVPIPFTEEALFDWTMRLGVVFHCPYCNLPLTRLSFSIDHRVPLARGGSMELSNLDAICGPCNAYKGDLDDVEYRRLRECLDELHMLAQKSIYQRLKSGGFRWVKPKEIAA